MEIPVLKYKWIFQIPNVKTEKLIQHTVDTNYCAM